MTKARHIYEVRLRNISRWVVCVCLIAVETPSFATDTDRAAAVLQREGVTIGGGDGSSFEKAIIVHAANPQMAVLAGDEYISLRYRLWQISSYRLSIYKAKYYFVMTYDEFRTIGPFPNKKKRVFYLDMSQYARIRNPTAKR
jgi:hypothetical protein